MILFLHLFISFWILAHVILIIIWYSLFCTNFFLLLFFFCSKPLLIIIMVFLLMYCNMQIFSLPLIKHSRWNIVFSVCSKPCLEGHAKYINFRGVMRDMGSGRADNICFMMIICYGRNSYGIHKVSWKLIIKTFTFVYVVLIFSRVETPLWPL